MAKVKSKNNVLPPPLPDIHLSKDAADKDSFYRFNYEIWRRTGGYKNTVPDFTGLRTSIASLNTLVDINTTQTVQDALNEKTNSNNAIVILATMTPSDIVAIAAVDGITVTHSIMRVISATAGNVLITADPQLTVGQDGQFLIIEGSSDTQTVTLHNGDGLQLMDSEDMVLGLGNTITFIYNATRSLWIETSRSDSLYWRR